MTEHCQSRQGARCADLVLVLGVSPRTSPQSGVMLARIRPGGIFELLTLAWARALGYAPDELSGKRVRDLVQLEKPATGEVVAALLDENDARPLDVTLRCKDERRKPFRLHRRFDPYEQAVFVLADERPAERVETQRAMSAISIA
jgi:PAS domain-containing protein